MTERAEERRQAILELYRREQPPRRYTLTQSRDLQHAQQFLAHCTLVYISHLIYQRQLTN